MDVYLSPEQLDLRAEVLAMTARDNALELGLVDRVVGHGSRAIPELETAMHGSRVVGRLNIVTALRRIGDTEAVPLLRHVAAYDVDDKVRAEAEHTLQVWARTPDGRGKRARRALRRVSELRDERHDG